MRKIIIPAIALTVVFSACNNGSSAEKEAISLNTELDSISYAIGGIFGSEALKNLSEIDSVDKSIFQNAFTSTLNGDLNMLINAEDGQKMVQNYFQRIEEAKYADVIKEGEDFLSAFSAEENAMGTDSGLFYKTLKEGNGAQANVGDMVKIHYTGKFTDGITFDSSVERGEPITFQIGARRVIQGWDMITTLMKVGQKIVVAIPYDLAYGPQGRGSIPPYSTLVFEMELLEIVKP